MRYLFCLLGLAPSSLAQIALYDAGSAGNPAQAPHPSTQGWNTATGGSSSFTPISPDANTGLNAWEVSDPGGSSANSALVWKELPSNVVADAYLRGWEFSNNMRLTASGTTSSIAMVFADGFTLVDNHYEITLAIAGNDVFARDSWTGAGYSCPNAMDGDHHVFCMRSAPGSFVVEFLFDGQALGTVGAGFPSSSLLSRGPGFGAPAPGSGRARFNRVEFRYLDDLATPTCDPAAANSTGSPAELSALGSSYVVHNDLVLSATSLPLNQFGYLLASLDADFVANPGGSDGNLCLGGSIARFVGQTQSSGPAGSFSIPVDLGAIPSNPHAAVLPGESWYFQVWYRDQSTSNFTNGARITFH